MVTHECLICDEYAARVEYNLLRHPCQEIEFKFDVHTCKTYFINLVKIPTIKDTKDDRDMSKDNKSSDMNKDIDRDKDNKDGENKDDEIDKDKIKCNNDTNELWFISSSIVTNKCEDHNTIPPGTHFWSNIISKEKLVAAICHEMDIDSLMEMDYQQEININVSNKMKNILILVNQLQKTRIVGINEIHTNMHKKSIYLLYRFVPIYLKDEWSEEFVQDNVNTFIFDEQNHITVDNHNSVFGFMYNRTLQEYEISVYINYGVNNSEY